MREGFGSVWTTQFGDVPNGTWMRVLTEVSDEQLVQGLNRTIWESREFPPNAAQFFELCTREAQKPEPKPGYHKALPLDPPESDEHRAARKARGREHMQALKSAVRGRA